MFILMMTTDARVSVMKSLCQLSVSIWTMTAVKLKMRITKIRLTISLGWVLNLWPKKALSMRKVTFGTMEATAR